MGIFKKEKVLRQWFCGLVRRCVFREEPLKIDEEAIDALFDDIASAEDVRAVLSWNRQ